MKNPKTTWGGILVIAAGVLNFVSHILVGGAIDIETITVLVGAVTAGLALVNATDGTV